MSSFFTTAVILPLFYISLYNKLLSAKAQIFEQ